MLGGAFNGAVFDDDAFDELGAPLVAEPPHPVNWNLLTAEEAETEWIELNRWVNWLRRTYGLPASIIPPFWHRHPELVWELSALHLHWLSAYDPDQHGSAPFGWHWPLRRRPQPPPRLGHYLRHSARPRPSHPRTAWPGELPAGPVQEVVIADRDADLVAFVVPISNGDARRVSGECRFRDAFGPVPSRRQW